MNTLDRRTFLRVSASTAGGLLLGFHLPGCSREQGAAAPAAPAAPTAAGGEVNVWLAIEPDGQVLIRVAQSDMGQGVFTSMPMIVAEELEVDWQMVHAEYASPNRQVRENKPYQRMGTGGSFAVRHSRPYLQAAGASARERLRHAAAARWQVAVEECSARAGRIEHAASGRSLGYGELAREAAALAFDDAAVTIREPAAFRLLGTPQRRLDVPDKVRGATRFGADVRLPGMLYAAVAHCPVAGGRLVAHDKAAIAGMRGVVDTVALEDAVAVVADSWWRAARALAALPVTWDHGSGAGSSSEAWEREYLEALGTEGMVAVDEGDAAAALAAAARRVEADYHAPYLAHACMEPMNCTVRIAEGKLELWAGVQNPEGALRAAAETAGLDPAVCEVHTCMLGGGFGRRSYVDFVREAVRVAMAVGKPVQTLWSREEDTRRGAYRPMAAWRFRAGLDGAGRASGFHCQSIAHSINLSNGGEANELDDSSVEGIANLPYAVGARRITHTMTRSHLHTWYWRSVGSSQNAWALECFIDELAVAAGRDPFDFRRELLAARPDFLHVLDVLQEKSGWGRALPAGSAQGLAIHEAFGTIVGQVAEVSVTRAGVLRLERVVAAVDCGHVVNPLTVAEQVESGIAYGLSAALYGRLTVKDGAVVEGNFDTYPVLRLREMPRVETHLALSGGDKWGGMGEPGLPPAAPAVCNAIFRVTGKRIRRLPLAGQDLTWGSA